MNYYEIITINEKEKWDNTVKSFEKFDVNYMNAYAESFQLSGEGEPFLFYYNDGNTRAINVFMKRDIGLSKNLLNKIELNRYFDISTPYGYGGFLVEGNMDFDKVNSSYRGYCESENFVSEFVRFHLCNEYHLKYDGFVETNTRNIIRELDISLDEIYSDFEQKVRKSLKKASKANLEIEIDHSGEKFQDFLNIYYSTMERNDAKDNFYFKSDFFETINSMRNHIVYFHVLYEGKVISTELVLYGKENCYSFLGGTDKEYFHLNSNNFLKYEIIKWAKSIGLKRFILGGGYGQDDGIYKYKKSFAPSGIYDFYIGKNIFNEKLYNELIGICTKSLDFDASTSFFPLYRA